MSETVLDEIKDIPGYKRILKAVLKNQIQQLVEQLASYTDEESVILTASVTDGTLSHLGSDSGQCFLETNEAMKTQFLSFCLGRHHERKQTELLETTTYSPNSDLSSRSTKALDKSAYKSRHEPYSTLRAANRRGSTTSISSTNSQFSNYGASNYSNSLTDNTADDSLQMDRLQSREEIHSVEEAVSDTLQQCNLKAEVKSESVERAEFTDNIELPVQQTNGNVPGSESLSIERNEDQSFLTEKDNGHGFTAPHLNKLDYYSPKYTEEELVCNICGMTFKKKQNRKAHMSIHTGERPFMCTYCPKTFRTKSNLKSHLATHFTNA